MTLQRPGSLGLPMRRVSKFLKLPLADKLLLVQCVLAVAAVRLGLNLLSYNTLRRWLATQSSPQSANDDVTKHVGWGVETAARLLPGTTCLTKAFAAQWLLARSGYQSQ